MSISFVKNIDTSYLDQKFLDEEGFCRVLPANEFADLNWDDFRLWCVRNAVYLYPTLELVEWLKNFIGGRKAIEVAAGNGHLGHALGISMSDSGMQMMPEIISAYEKIGQACTKPPECVEILNAEDAVAKHKPDVVIASWLTHKWQPGMSTGNMLGPDESVIIANTQNYVHIGNDSVHCEKPIMPHAQYVEHFPWIISRARYCEGNHIAVWGNIAS